MKRLKDGNQKPFEADNKPFRNTSSLSSLLSSRPIKAQICISHSNLPVSQERMLTCSSCLRPFFSLIPSCKYQTFTCKLLAQDLLSVAPADSTIPRYPLYKATPCLLLIRDYSSLRLPASYLLQAHHASL